MGRSPSQPNGFGVGWLSDEMDWGLCFRMCDPETIKYGHSCGGPSNEREAHRYPFYAAQPYRPLLDTQYLVPGSEMHQESSTR